MRSYDIKRVEASNSSTRELVKSVKISCTKYQIYLDDMKKETVLSERDIKRDVIQNSDLEKGALYCRNMRNLLKKQKNRRILPLQ